MGNFVDVEETIVGRDECIYKFISNLKFLIVYGWMIEN